MKGDVVWSQDETDVTPLQFELFVQLPADRVSSLPVDKHKDKNRAVLPLVSKSVF